jgi:hypothetical protein
LRIRIRDPVPFSPLDPGLGLIKNRIQIRNGQPESYFREPVETIFWVKILKSFDADPGSGMEQIRIREGKKFGSGINIPDPQL